MQREAAAVAAEALTPVLTERARYAGESSGPGLRRLAYRNRGGNDRLSVAGLVHMRQRDYPVATHEVDSM